MKATSIALGLSTIIMAGLVVPATAQVVIHQNQSPEDDAAQDEVESDFLHAWNRHHDAPDMWGQRRNNFGPDDVIRLLERRGY